MPSRHVAFRNRDKRGTISVEISMVMHVTLLQLSILQLITWTGRFSDTSAIPFYVTANICTVVSALINCFGRLCTVTPLHGLSAVKNCRGCLCTATPLYGLSAVKNCRGCLCTATPLHGLSAVKNCRGCLCTVTPL